MLDLAVLAVVGVSALLGLLRGFVGMVVATVSWILAGWASFRFGAQAGDWLAGSGQADALHHAGGYVAVFLLVLVLVAVAGWLIRAAVDATRLTGADRALGFALGALRGALLACVLVLVAGFTPLVRSPAWNESLLLPWLAPLAGWMRAQLPGAPQLADAALNAGAPGLGNGPGSGDNAVLRQPIVGDAVHSVVGRVLGHAEAGHGAGGEQDSKAAWPASIEPEPEPAAAQPARQDGSPGRQRP
ncbi:CvpA family protein [Xanthomonas massiliensis]|uniref:CvpA family protein n=1 Tax=Xanthomonas massiliensis TaxID=1720302 RepID=UPI000826CDD9|nr:CvpA family protein [Xanthomonas massiliensis]